MDLRVTFRKVPGSELGAWRTRYLDSLESSQELFLEVMVADSQAYLVEARGEAIGYVIAHRDEKIIEFFLAPAQWVFGQTVLRQFATETGIERAWIKSFDHLFFSSAIDDQRSVRTIGLLSRDYLRRSLPDDPAARLTRVLATLPDFERVRAIEQDVFVHPERLRGVIAHGHMSLFCQGEQLVGFGIYRAVISGRPAVDLGIAIDRPYRNHGYGVHMLQQMMDHCVELGLVPVGGCALDNPASRAMAERTGLVARYRLLELTLR
jgi:GNAT superfamily N-acetyltransferase